MPPVEDHPVHALTVKASILYDACQNKVRLPSVMSMTCRYDRSETDLGCQDCQQPKDVEFIAQIKARK